MRHTGQCADHGESSESAGQTLPAHDGGGVGGGEDPCQPEQTALKNRPKCWTKTTNTLKKKNKELIRTEQAWRQRKTMTYFLKST